VGRRTGQSLAQPRDVREHHPAGGRRWFLPGQLDQPIHRYALAALQQKQRREQAALRRTKVDRLSVGPGLDGAEETELDRRTVR
jgi:hypothetical protein